jgi:hypothetical protein
MHVADTKRKPLKIRLLLLPLVPLQVPLQVLAILIEDTCCRESWSLLDQSGTVHVFGLANSMPRIPEKSRDPSILPACFGRKMLHQDGLANTADWTSLRFTTTIVGPQWVVVIVK